MASILLVDDDVQILETALDVLEAAGFDVHAAATGREALEHLRQNAYRVMVSDYNLPDMTGAELAVQAHALCPPMTIFLMTGQAQVDLGPAVSIVKNVMLKPVNPSELIQILHTHS